MIARSPVVSDADGSLLDVGSIPASPFLAWFLLNLLSSWEMDLAGQHTAHQWLRLGAYKWRCDGPFVPPNGVGLWRAQLFESFVAWSMPTWPQVFLLFFISTSFLFILFYVSFLCLTGCYVSLSPFQYSNANKICSNLDAYMNSMSYANSRLMLTITDFSLSHAVWAWYQIHDDFFFYSMTFSEVCHRYWAQTRARMSYLQICDENS